MAAPIAPKVLHVDSLLTHLARLRHIDNRRTPVLKTLLLDLICETNKIEQRLTTPNHPWDCGQMEGMSRTITEVPVKRFHFDSPDQIGGRLSEPIAAHFLARSLKALNGLPA